MKIFFGVVNLCDRRVRSSEASFSSGTHLLHRLLHLLGGDVADMRADRPLMTERVFDFAVTIAPEHIVEGHRDFRPGAHRLVERQSEIRRDGRSGAALM